jgi:hypothetical protein
MPSADSIPPDPIRGDNQLTSPRPEPPTAKTPGPRATLFLNLYQKTLSTTLRTISYDNFAACFPTIATNAPENLRGLHKAMIERLEGFAQVRSFSTTIKSDPSQSRHIPKPLSLPHFTPPACSPSKSTQTTVLPTTRQKLTAHTPRRKTSKPSSENETSSRTSTP